MSSASQMPPLDPERIRAIRDALTQGLVEREVPVRLALLAALAGEHLLLIGPPGTAKSLIARRLRLALKDGAYFERLLTRFTVPEELFGPLSVKALEDDKYLRQTDAYLPAASVAFLDEIFKANSAILNALLTLLNERMFDNGTQREHTPLVAAIGASNELPEGPELGALYDRFLMRLHVGPVSKDGFKDLLSLRGEGTPKIPDELKLTDAELKAWQAAAVQVAVPDDVLSMLGELREWCLAEKITVSDRRWRKLLKLLQVSALTNGRSEVAIWDCWLVQHCLWETPEQREGIYDWYAKRVGASAAMDPKRLTKVVVAWEAQLPKDKAKQEQLQDDEGQLLFRDGEELVSAGSARRPKLRNGECVYKAPAGSESRTRNGWWEDLADRSNGLKGFTRDELHRLRVNGADFRYWQGATAYLADSDNQLYESVDLKPAMEPHRHPPEYVQQCIEQLDRHADEVTTYLAQLQAHLDELEDTAAKHLWVTSEFLGPAQTTLGETQQNVRILARRLQIVTEGYRALPVADRKLPNP